MTDLDTFFAFQDVSFDPDRALDNGSFTDMSQALAAANAAHFDYNDTWMMDPSLLNLSKNSTASSSPLTPGTPIIRPKLGSRFSRDVIRTLKDWLAVHQQHPYPNEDEVRTLEDRTGLNKAQLTNWFANARRRGKVQNVRPASPQVQNMPNTPIDIIPRPDTPAFGKTSRFRDPMQRWVESPPEHEPAAVGDIARAMASGSPAHGQGAPRYVYTSNDMWRSPYDVSSASSAGTSHSSEFSAHHSSGSQSSRKMRRAPRRKRVTRCRRIEKEHTAVANMPYQCTFCTEVFKTKFDWQRHEKSVHLPLEQWICALQGPRTTKKGIGERFCVFCGEIALDDSHIESHHYSECQKRSLNERTFHRKDHLVQHLRLVHQAEYMEWSMARWMLPMPSIRSRCGFCGITMDNWAERTDHLADHFKAGTTMASWQGDWGFDDAIADLVETAIPPYLIEWERGTLIPMKGSDPSWGTPPNAYELLKVEIEFFIQHYFDKHTQLPDSNAMQLEACRIIFAAETTSNAHSSSEQTTHTVSWLSDLIMSSPELTRQARFGPIRAARESRHFPLKINAKDYLFELCPMEAQLRAFVTEQKVLGVMLGEGQLHHEACQIVRQMEKESSTPSHLFANWVIKNIYSGTEWLKAFKQRTGVLDAVGVTDLAAELSLDPAGYFQSPQSCLSALSPSAPTHSSTETPEFSPIVPEEATTPPTQIDMYGRLRVLLPDDTNFYRVFDSDMRRWAAATLSPKNPNCHVPSDEEIQHQARWIMYDGDDPWNQTPADYPDWLWRFKRDVGILGDGEVGVGVVDPRALVI
ncbi:hypothetical protein EJ02DRAFT_117900 [Clathrospora elynae]|uniref:Homeobox domain-containing protein n=1 Tax=Clathrospora elynae TaxID=706981 RepID=A0A6A5SUH2_9PLEO|nr:hypothetical protein EJ02DRAFT_117900 [Clathrospora elynae]